MASHIPVLFDETISALHVRPSGRYIDGTLGRAGHARGLVERGGFVLGIDRDDEALSDVEALRASDEVLRAHLEIQKGRHGEMLALAHAHGWDEVDGVLLDLGVSSPQLDEGARGFSFLRPGPLDMRMDRTQKLTAAEIVNTFDEAALVDIFRRFGEEPRARRLANRLLAARARGVAFKTTDELAAFIERELGRTGAHHPATRVFQALRMAVNDEAGELTQALDAGLSLLRPGGRFAVITFESITDRIVKQFFARHAGREVSRQEGGSRWEGETPRVKLVTRRAVRAGADEVAKNPRARSAKLRVAERM